jgi:hypothetical protein
MFTPIENSLRVKMQNEGQNEKLNKFYGGGPEFIEEGYVS